MGHVVDYMVLNSLIQDVPERDEEWKKKRVDDVARYSIHSLGIALSDLLSPECCSVSGMIRKRSSGIMSGEFTPRSVIPRMSSSLRCATPSQGDRGIPLINSNRDSAMGLGNMSNLPSLRIRKTNESTLTYTAYVDGVLNRAFEVKGEEEMSPTLKLADVP